MPKPRISVQEAASTITGSILRFSAQATQQIGGRLVPRMSFLKRAFSSRNRKHERLEGLKLYCDLVIPHVAVAEYNLEHSDYWDRTNTDIVDLIRQLSLQAIGQTFERAGCGVIYANFFVRSKAERFAVAEEIMKDHELPSKMSAAELVGFLAPSRISTYKELWAEDQERMLRLQRPSTADLLSKVRQHWRGAAPPSHDWDVLQFNLILEGSLFGLNLVITKACYDIEIA